MRTCQCDCDSLRAELETERMKVVACGVAAMCNTNESAEKQRIPRDNPYWSASYGDVCAAIDREMQLRAELERVSADRDEWKDNERVSHECFEASQEDLAVSQSREKEAVALAAAYRSKLEECRSVASNGESSSVVWIVNEALDEIEKG